jgi:hypothetical protein
MSADAMSGIVNASGHGELIEYDYAVIRIVPHAHREAFENAGVVLHARTVSFLGCRIRTDFERMAGRSPNLDIEHVKRSLRSFDLICVGGQEAGALGLLPPSERFHWLTAPRSAVVQSSAVHGGRTRDPAAALDQIFESYGLDSHHLE